MNSLKPAALWRKLYGNTSQFNDIVNGQQFKMAITVAIAEYAQECANRQDGASRMLGAKEVVEKILNLGMEPSERRVSTFNLPVEETINQ